MESHYSFVSALQYCFVGVTHTAEHDCGSFIFMNVWISLHGLTAIYFSFRLYIIFSFQFLAIMENVANKHFSLYISYCTCIHVSRQGIYHGMGLLCQRIFRSSIFLDNDNFFFKVLYQFTHPKTKC